MAEQNEVDELLREIRTLSGPPETEPEPQVAAEHGTVRYELRAFSADIERDDKGFISRIVSPEAIHTVVRDEMHRVVRLDTETETLTSE